ncbi:DUF2306 domain-containing protein [Xylanibacillus composti]|uniref:DUF2306 domain-containing protein n=1 Tax=Xylanibacillus composti TaxID=1572762 RepID=A0A8J4M372_9BACL|nr:DUF2306 domain-containing protein [Xylanibacillus composti]MDT9725301.1 DUF2306 domain-containing protein [Xylanibacillus composti]GIQ70504.1 hypothetical protein XYCOK13_33280 [Xylanibacillus composti]
MQVLFDIMRWTHIVGGFLALSVFWLPIVAKKGGRVHNNVGWVYVWAMAAVSVTAFFMGIYRLTWDAGPDADAIPFSWFLLFIAILSSATAWYGVRVLRYKRRKAGHRNPVDLLFPSLLFGAGIGISIYGFAIDFPLLQYFPLLGLFLGGSQLLYWLKAPKTRSHWVVEHIVGMLSCCIATVTAFTVFGAPRLLQVDSVSLLVWFLPTIVLVPLIIGFTIVYKRKMDRPINR